METKFRVWCEFEINGQIEKCMESPASWFLLTQVGQLMEYGPMRAPQKPSGAYKKLIPLFFTGRLDKNGQEIYQGDIVRAVDEMVDKSFIGLVEYFPACCWFGILIDGIPERGHLNFKDVNNNIEVIGNIYENPELLKKG